MTRRGIQPLWPEAQRTIQGLSLEKRSIYEGARKKALLDSVTRQGPTRFTQEEIAVLNEVTEILTTSSTKETKR
jgi:hypothetical protein